MRSNPRWHLKNKTLITGAGLFGKLGFPFSESHGPMHSSRMRWAARCSAGADIHRQSARGYALGRLYEAIRRARRDQGDGWGYCVGFEHSTNPPLPTGVLAPAVQAARRRARPAAAPDVSCHQPRGSPGLHILLQSAVTAARCHPGRVDPPRARPAAGAHARHAALHSRRSHGCFFWGGMPPSPS